jgi:hypothetical protein
MREICQSETWWTKNIKISLKKNKIQYSLHGRNQMIMMFNKNSCWTAAVTSWSLHGQYSQTLPGTSFSSVILLRRHLAFLYIFNLSFFLEGEVYSVQSPSPIQWLTNSMSHLGVPICTNNTRTIYRGKATCPRHRMTPNNRF